MTKCNNAFDWIVLIIMVIGGLNWGLVGLFHWDLVAAIFGMFSVISRIIYIIVGLCAIYVLVTALRRCSKM
jgi:uncharacterized membrane protein YuzA (DUF378 family)